MLFVQLHTFSHGPVRVASSLLHTEDFQQITLLDLAHHTIPQATQRSPFEERCVAILTPLCS
ncbi:hypothetical protein KSF_109960 [Reticulibacter mediterranei]|uniref:Uncharacterized protein n=1 Tax=Reticulibacter mediterranei TaxID=2778369 RepID=A0A8J3IYQ0_9CHLR|nr:hypothetical protein [Reticulibacter mediterranei]GHP00949.1 hypothetical protein KSF_109960 [Reticulibacter mediterranei]